MTREIEWLRGMPGSTKAKRTLHIQEGLVSYQEIAADLPALAANWFNYYDQMEAILNLYFTAISKGDIPANTRFLLLAQALKPTTVAVTVSLRKFNLQPSFKLDGTR